MALKRLMRLGIAILSLCLFPLNALAEDKPLEATLEVFKITTKSNGEEQRVEVKSASPGDILEYTGTYRNHTDDPVTGLAVDNEIARNTRFILGGLSSSHQAKFEVLIKGEEWQSLPAYKRIVSEDGSTKRVLADPSDFAKLRWTLQKPLDGKDIFKTVYRVKINE